MDNQPPTLLTNHDASTKKPLLRKLSRKYQLAALQSKLANMALTQKMTPNALAQLVKSWAALETLRVSSPSFGTGRASTGEKCLLPSPDPANEITFVESLPGELAVEYKDVVATRKPPE